MFILDILDAILFSKVWFIIFIFNIFVDSSDEEDIKKEEEENIKPKKPLPKKGCIDFTPNALL